MRGKFVLYWSYGPTVSTNDYINFRDTVSTNNYINSRDFVFTNYEGGVKI
jgi:hypothetical protein